MSTNIKKIPQKKHDVVFGFIKQQIENKICDNLPIELIKMILVFYYICTDEWDKNAIGSNIKINDNTIEHVGSDYKHQSAFLSNIVSSGVHIWKFQVI